MNDHQLASLAPLAKVLDETVFAELIDVIGAQKAFALIDVFGRDLARRVAAPEDPVALSKDAHAIASAAGIIGFTQLSTKAKIFEEAFINESAFEDALRDFLAERTQVSRLLSYRLAS